jgi:hypothetical protein
MDQLAAARELDEQQSRIRRQGWTFATPSLITNGVIVLHTSGVLATLGTAAFDFAFSIAAIAMVLSLFAIPCFAIGAGRNFGKSTAGTRILLVILGLLSVIPLTIVGMYLAGFSDLS